MEKEIAEILVNGLEKHPEIKKYPGIITDKDKLIKMLVDTNVPESSRFYERLPNVKQSFNVQSGLDYYISPRRVLRNGNAKNYQLSESKEHCGNIASDLAIYSSDVLVRDLRTDEAIVKMMEESSCPYSLLGKFQKIDRQNWDGTLKETRPLLVIPCTNNMEKILEWERANTIYKRQDKSTMIFKRITAEEYFCHPSPSLNNKLNKASRF